MLDLVGNPNCWFCHAQAHVLLILYCRDRVKFVLTSDMAYVINDGDRQSDKFQHFVDISCQAFNILRKHANLFINLFSLVS